MRGAVKLLAALLALEDGDLVKERVTIEVVRTIEPLAAYLTEEDLVFGVRVREDMTLKQVLSCEPLPAHLT